MGGWRNREGDTTAVRIAVFKFHTSQIAGVQEAWGGLIKGITYFCGFFGSDLAAPQAQKECAQAQDDGGSHIL